MARPLRIEYPGAFYHITSRGNERKDIFRDDNDRQRFLGYLETAVNRYDATVHVYCLMNNHYHLLLSTPKGNLSQILRHINGGYTTWFNKRHARAGHLFQGRYKAILVEADPYAGELSRYIHLNPVRAGITTQPKHYLWSSYRYYINATKVPVWLTTDWLLGYFRAKTVDARKAYRLFVEAAMSTHNEDPLKAATSSLILGKPSFVKAIKEKYLVGKGKSRDLPELRELRKIPLREIVSETDKEFGAEHVTARKAALYMTHRYSGRPLREIGKEFGLGESGVSQASRRFEAEMMVNWALRRRIERVRKVLAL